MTTTTRPPDICSPMQSHLLSDKCFGRLIRIGDLIASDVINDPPQAVQKLRDIIHDLSKDYNPIRNHLKYRVRQLRELSR